MQPRASAGSAAAHMPQRPQQAAPGAGDAWGSRNVRHRTTQKAAAVHLGVYPEELSTHGHRTRTGVSEQLRLEALNLEAPKMSSVAEWVDSGLHSFIQWNIIKQ